MPALHLAEAAVETASAAGPVRTRAFLLGQLAVAQAAVGDRRAALNRLGTAEALLERADCEPGAVGAFHLGSLAHQHAAVALSAGDSARAISSLRTSVRLRPPDERRSRAVALSRLAEVQFAAGRLEAACATWHEFCDEYPRLHAARIEQALAVLRRRTAAHLGNPAARALHARATALRTQHRALT
jgi:tetratricopeptide (TPR) repeat protein